MKHETQSQHSVPMNVCANSYEIGMTLAKSILDKIKTKNARFLLGCPGGRSLASTYECLGKIAPKENADFSNLVIVMMDNYVFPKGDSFVHCPAEAHYSCDRFAHQEIVALMNKDLAANKHIRPENIWFPNPANPGAYDGKISTAGGIDLFLLASGATDGHVAFNPPGSPIDSVCRIIPLPDTTRTDNMGTFPDFKTLDDVPRFGVSVGLGSISTLSKDVVMVIHGSGKKDALTRLLSYDSFCADWPATVVYACKKATIMTDIAAHS